MPSTTLPDPTNFGNQPGDGPLRVGGVAGTDPVEDKHNKPSTRSPLAERQQPELKLVRDLCEGTPRLRSRSTVYLPKGSGEDTGNYQSRLNRSVFFNAFKRSVEGLTGLIFRRDPVLGDDVPAKIVEHWENIDNAGTHGDVFCREITQDDLIAGHAAILVDYPPVSDEAQASGEASVREAADEIRPYWVPIKKDDIMSWRTMVVDGRTALQQIVLREQTYEAVGEFGQALVTRYRVLYRDDTGVHWKLLRETDDDRVIEEDAGDYPTQDEIPVAEITSSGRRGIFDSDPPLCDLAHLNVAHYQMWSDYMWSAHKTNVPFIFGAGIDTRDEQGVRQPLNVGANSAITTPDPQAKMEYVAHSGESLGATKQALDDLKSDMGALGVGMLAPQKRAAETAEAKRLDKSTSDSALAVTARGVQDGLERALYFHARYMRLPSGGSIEINRDFEGMVMEPAVMQAVASLVKGGMPVILALEMLQMGGRIAEDQDLEALEILWEIGYKAMADQGDIEDEPEPDNELEDEAA